MTSEQDSLFETAIERSAEHAEDLAAFRGLKLYAVREEVGKILAFVGRDGIFRQYTKHDISHIDRMLHIGDWLIPEASRSAQSPADWLLLTLAIYFHDLGMVVTQAEFVRRNESGFREFAEDLLSQENYRHRVETLGRDEADSFLYQEFVRANHPVRVRQWINGRLDPEYGAAVELAAVVTDLLGRLPREFRDDLGKICESHHLSDLDDFDKYPVSRPYGESESETANIQYAALILRTADLLHITRDRAPTIEARLISPQDPVSQVEWEKQQAVTNVRPKLGKNVEGDDDPAAPRTAIEVFATFTNAEGFFGLNAYINYAREQLRLSHEWAQLAIRRRAVRQEFPWRTIDDANVKAEGFIPKQFEFELDQPRILNLLTGHTLYNDSGVVLRELIQNSLDAVRLRGLESSASAGYLGSVEIRWNPDARRLDILDNGTGMTQEIIEEHLLKVGSSRYQDERFTRRYPEFSAISRFGIGVLTAFMVSDTVDVYTRSAEEEGDGAGRYVALRSLHGRYLVRLLDRAACAGFGIQDGGTLVRLSLRPDAELPDVLDTMRRWVVIPRCTVRVQQDERDEGVLIGAASVSEALVADLQDLGLAASQNESDCPAILVRSSERGGVSVAYGVRWSEFFRVWELAVIGTDRPELPRLGTSIEGIRVEEGSPGYTGVKIAAIANASGPSAPKTNVARSGIEVTAERDRMLALIYEQLADHITGEIGAMTESRGFSVTKASSEATYLLGPLMEHPDSRDRRSSPDPIDEARLNEALCRIPFALVDGEGGRRLMKPDDLASREIWTIDAPAFSSIESTLRSAQRDLGLAEVVEVLGVELDIPDGLILAAPAPYQHPRTLIFQSREVTRLLVRRDLPQVAARWSAVGEPTRWIRTAHTLHARGLADPLGFEPYGLEPTFGRRGPREAFIPRSDDIFEEVDGFSGIESYGDLYLTPFTPIVEYMRAFEARFVSSRSDGRQLALAMVHSLLVELVNIEGTLADPGQLIARRLERLDPRSPEIRGAAEEILALPDLTEAIARTEWRTFSTSRWRRDG
jgi:hypothetical protein